MQHHSFGRLSPVSVLTLGGGGIGMLWGETSHEECVATVRAAVDAGIDLLDLAPRYGDGKAELVVGEAFGGKLPAGVRVTSKCLLGDTPAAEVETRLRRSIAESLESELIALTLPIAAWIWAAVRPSLVLVARALWHELQLLS